MKWFLGAYFSVVALLLWVIFTSAPRGEEVVASEAYLVKVTMPSTPAAEVEHDVVLPITPTATTFVPSDRLMEFTPDDTLPLPPDASTLGRQGLPFAPVELFGCEETECSRIQRGLPAYFGAAHRQMGRKSSNSGNDVSSYCCHGYWQLYVSLHLKDHRLAPLYAECGISSVSDILGVEPLKKQKNACGAAAVLSVSGCEAWDTCPF